MQTDFLFSFGNFPSTVKIQEELPLINELTDTPALIICDNNTKNITHTILRGETCCHVLTLKSGEITKTWESVETIVSAASALGLGRDALFIGVGGGVISDLCGFAASVYKRGARLCLVSTTLLGMVDAAIGGKTAINLLNLKNLTGTFYPAENIVLPLAALDTLPEREWKSGMAELIKTAIIDSSVNSCDFLYNLKQFIKQKSKGLQPLAYREGLKNCISAAVACKGRIVEADPFEKGTERVLLNLGHTFGHALESSAGFGVLSHGEAIAWGLARECELGLSLGITPPGRAREITGILKDCGYEIRAPHALVNSCENFIKFMMADKKQISSNEQPSKLRFVVPNEKSAQTVSIACQDNLIKKIIKGESPL